MSDILDSDKKQRKIVFIQGEAGRGKSTFCRMFAAEVLSLWYPAFIPILIRLRALKNISDLVLRETLKGYLQNWTFACSETWLSDRSRRYLLIFDGLDELVLQNRRSEGVEKLLQQIESFQKDSHNQCIITGRPLVLQGINLDRIITQTKNLKRVEIELMDDRIREEWLEKWAKEVGEEEKEEFCEFLQQCPEAVNNLAREPLLLYLLARMHREERLSIQKFAERSETETKIEIYSESIEWVLEKQRDNQNFRITGLETEDLRRFLREAALCVVQLGNETAPLKAIEARLKDNYKPIKELIQKDTDETKTDEKKALNNLLTCFYIKPGEKDPSGSIEFTHKSFGEFLFAEKLTESLEKWTELDSRDENYDLNDDRLAEEIYDLLGYGGLTPEIVEYLTGMLYQSKNFEPVRLFERLENFFDRWCNGEFIDGKFIDERETTLAQKKGQLYP